MIFNSCFLRYWNIKGRRVKIYNFSKRFHTILSTNKRERETRIFMKKTGRLVFKSERKTETSLLRTL